jgi:hypothetical protein
VLEQPPKCRGVTQAWLGCGALMKSARGIFCIAALASVLCILLHESLFLGKGLVPADGILNWPPWNQTTHPSNAILLDQYAVFIPTQEFVHQEKSFPLWNPHLCCGVPNLGAIQGAMLFPIRLLLSPLDPFSASGPAAFLKLCLAGWFTLLYVRLLGGSHAAALLAGMTFSLSGFMIVWLGHPQVNSAMWLPLLLYFVEKAFRQGQTDAFSKPALRAWAGLAAAFACMILGGHPPTVIHVTIVLGLYFLFRLKEYGREQALPRVMLLAGSLAVGLLLAAPQILPFLEYYRQSSSAQASASMARWSSHLSFSSLIHFLLPDCMGNPARGFLDLPKLLGWHEADNFSETAVYVGILPLFLAAYGSTLRRCKITLFYVLLAIGCLLVICGVPPLPAVLRRLPVLRDINQQRLLLMVGFSVAVLAGLGWDEFSRRKSRRPTLTVTVGFCALVGAALLCFLCVTGPALRTLDASHWAFLRRQFLILAIGMIITVVLALWPAHWNGWLPMALCLSWTATDLLCFGFGYNPSIPRGLYYPKTPAIQWLQQDKSLFRVFAGPRVLGPNTAEVFGLSDARGVDFMTVRRYEELLTGKSGDFYFDMDPKNIPAALRLLNVKYMLAAKAISLDPSFFELVYSNGVSIYRFKECVERALLVFDYQVEPDRAALLTRVSSTEFDPRQVLLLEDQPAPAQTPVGDRPTPATAETSVRILSYEPDDVSVAASLPRPGYLLLLDTYFPGWSATVNGAPVPILRADYNFRAVSLPAGRSTVRFSYSPQSLRIGLYLCAAGILALGAALFLPRKGRCSRAAPDAGATQS